MLLVTSNGTGMGHVVRQTAVAQALSGRADVVLMSLSSGLSHLARDDLRTEYLPSYQRPWIPRHEWDRYLADRVRALVTEVSADVVAFDGVAPYWGLLRARHALPDVAFAWFRRGMWRPGRNTAALRSTRFFDAVIEPGDLGDLRDRGPTRVLAARRVPPVSLLDVIEPMPRADAAAALGLDPDRPTALVTLGSGALGNDDAAATAAVAGLRGAGYAVALTRAALGGSGAAPDGAVVLSGVYPMAAYVRAFDVVVSAAGYNAVHEFVTAGVATVLVPNLRTGVDDQLARAEGVADAGAAVVADPREGAEGVVVAVRQAIAQRVDLAERAVALGARRGPGSQVAADALLELVGGRRSDDPADRAAYVATDAAETAASAAQAVLGRDRLRRWARRPAEAPSIRSRLAVDLELDAPMTALWRGASAPGSGARRLIVTSSLDAGLVDAADPVEHVLAGATSTYLDERIAIARRTYDVRGVVPATAS